MVTGIDLHSCCRNSSHKLTLSFVTQTSLYVLSHTTVNFVFVKKHYTQQLKYSPMSDINYQDTRIMNLKLNDSSEKANFTRIDIIQLGYMYMSKFLK